MPTYLDSLNYDGVLIVESGGPLLRADGSQVLLCYALHYHYLEGKGLESIIFRFLILLNGGGSFFTHRGGGGLTCHFLPFLETPLNLDPRVLLV